MKVRKKIKKINKNKKIIYHQNQNT